jgi:hypothetical protein
MEKKQMIKELIVHSFRGTNPNPTKYQDSDIRKATSEAIHELAHDFNSYRRNKIDIFEIMQEAYDEILPKSVEEFMGTFAEIKQVKDNEKAQFVVKRGRQRAKQFVTKVGLSGAYEAFRLDKDTFEVSATAIGGTSYIDFERYICGDEDIAESAEILLEGLIESVYGEVQKALIASVNADNRPAKNKAITAGFDPDAMRRLVRIAGAYGDGGVTIFATPEFVQEMGPEAVGMPMAWTRNSGATGVATPVYNPRNIDEIAQYGRIKTFGGQPIVEIPQSFTDETNTTTIVNPALAYVFPNGSTKPVKIVFEGETHVDEFKNRDRSFEVEAYKKVGVGIITNHNWCVYVNTDLQDTTAYPTKYPTHFIAE